VEPVGAVAHDQRPDEPDQGGDGLSVAVVGGADQGVDLVADTGSAGPRGAGLWCLDKDVVSFAEHRTPLCAQSWVVVHHSA
jgi:hypothetical protein